MGKRERAALVEQFFQAVNEVQDIHRVPPHAAQGANSKGEQT
jgi:hypothetical protein